MLVQPAGEFQANAEQRHKDVFWSCVASQALQQGQSAGVAELVDGSRQGVTDARAAEQLLRTEEQASQRLRQNAASPATKPVNMESPKNEPTPAPPLIGFLLG
jgi:hypothetical protein